MKGAMIGDVIGSIYESERDNIKVKDFPLFKPESHLTDDSVLTIAVANALMTCREDGLQDDGSIIRIMTQNLQKYGRLHIDAGYSRRFRAWLLSEDPQPYQASSNGAIMRCSAAGFLAGSFEEARRWGELSAMPSHNHPEALAAAAMTAELVFRARCGASKDDLLAAIRAEYDVPGIDKIRPVYRFDMSSKGTLPVAFACFYESTDFEDAIRTAVSLGGDADTNAAIAGCFAEAFYGVPDALWQETKARCSEDILEVIARWEDACRAG